MYKQKFKILKVENKDKKSIPEIEPVKKEKLKEPRSFTVTEPFLYGDKRQKIGDKIILDDVQTINNLTPKYIR